MQKKCLYIANFHVPNVSGPPTPFPKKIIELQAFQPPPKGSEGINNNDLYVYFSEVDKIFQIHFFSTSSCSASLTEYFLRLEYVSNCYNFRDTAVWSSDIRPVMLLIYISLYTMISIIQAKSTKTGIIDPLSLKKKLVYFFHSHAALKNCHSIEIFENLSLNFTFLALL